MKTRLEQIESTARRFTPGLVGCSCPLIYERGGWPHDAECMQGMFYDRIVEALCCWDRQCAWERAIEETEWRAKATAATVTPLEYSAPYQAWQRAQAMKTQTPARTSFDEEDAKGTPEKQPGA